jgi:hypothetical protein
MCLNLQKTFEIKLNDLDYAIGVVLTQHGNLTAYNSETLSSVV